MAADLQLLMAAARGCKTTTVFRSALERMTGAVWAHAVEDGDGIFTAVLRSPDARLMALIMVHRGNGPLSLSLCAEDDAGGGEVVAVHKGKAEDVVKALFDAGVPMRDPRRQKPSEDEFGAEVACMEAGEEDELRYAVKAAGLRWCSSASVVSNATAAVIELTRELGSVRNKHSDGRGRKARG